MNGIRLRYVVPLHEDLIHDSSIESVDAESASCRDIPYELTGLKGKAGFLIPFGREYHPRRVMCGKMKLFSPYKMKVSPI